ncbi:MAG: MarR family winged helix-turn-helix transcriptional regulator [Rhodoglobus sp.]
MDEQRIMRLSSAIERLTRLLRRADLPGELSTVAASTLYTLATEGPSRLTTLAEAEHITQPAMTQLVTRLERDGLVVRAPDPSDGRAVLVEATPEGVALSTARRAARAEALQSAITSLSSAEVHDLSQAIGALERIAAGPPAS